ncbi:MAG: flagellar M-ring protein FliF [Alphaproteobacteria bacterium]|nr:flagellar M-ring protein FliF [Alphaproteobacteria bacterium]
MDFITFLQRLGLLRMAITAGLLLSLGWFMMFFAGHLSQPDMALLYGDLDVGEAGRIVTRLEEQNIPMQIKAGGTQILVPIDQVARIRMDMAEAGLPNGGSVGYEIFDKSDVFGTSFFVQNVNQVRALEGELSRTIRTLNMIASARVHLVLPKRELFNNDQQQPTASIVLRMQAAGRIDDARVRAIQHLVAAAVPNLTPERVSVVDDRGNLLSASMAETGEKAALQKTEEMRASYEAKLESAIRSLLERTVGVGKVRTTVAVDMDFDKLTENSEIFDPDGQVQRSTQTISDDSSSGDAGGGVAGVGNELPNATAGGTGKNQSKRTEETVNFEISKTIKNYTKESGSIKKMSIAVLVDGNRTPAATEGGKETYEPRKPEELAQIEKLVKSAVGFDEKRGDTLEVVNMAFTNDPVDMGQDIVPNVLGFESHHIVRLIETGIIALIGLLMMLLVIKPLLNRVFEALSTKENSEGAAAPVVLAPAVAPVAAPIPANQSDPGIPQSANTNQSGGNGQKSPTDQVKEMVDQNPDETAALVKNWMNQ